MVSHSETDQPGGKIAAKFNRWRRAETQGRGKKKTKYYFDNKISRNSIIFLCLALFQGNIIVNFSHTMIQCNKRRPLHPSLPNLVRMMPSGHLPDRWGIQTPRVYARSSVCVYVYVYCMSIHLHALYTIGDATDKNDGCMYVIQCMILLK